MQVQTNAIVLSAIKYKDTSLIVRCYTQEYGMQSYILHHILNGKKKKINSAYFQLLSQIEIQVTRKNNSNLQTVSEVKLQHAYQSLQTNIYKSTVVLFLSEMLQNVLKEEEKNNNLYTYLENTLLWYDLNEFNPNFHILFLLKLTQHLGIYPDSKKLQFNFFKEHEIEKITTLKTLLGMNFDMIHTIKINAQIRNEILVELINYFNLHLGDFKKPKSLAILHNVFK